MLLLSEVQQLKKTLPPGVRLEPYYDQSELVRESIRSVRDAILIGLVLACVILFLFLGDWTSSLVAGLVIPVTVAITILFLWTIGESFNLMTLGGLAAAIGLVIDDAIVVVENIVLHRDDGETRAEAARLALRGDCRSARRLDHHSCRRLPSSDLGDRRYGKFLSRTRRHDDDRTAYFSASRHHMDTGAEPGVAARAP